KEACCNYAGYAFEYQAKRLLIDTSNFQFQMPADFEQWRDDHHYPRLWKLGVEKMAFLMPESVMAFVEDKAAEFGKFPVRYFVQEGEAMEWLGE
ncbi:MAG: STAS/SEC14 domain-containing protein, partial [Bacteroidota bacterium]